jgi:hypothetical protein
MSYTLSIPNVCNRGIVPKLIFIVPYRDRAIQLETYLSTMKNVMADYYKDEYKIWILHQSDNRAFNRGALKNIGFCIAKEHYPTAYQNITLVFNDVDSVTSRKDLFHFETRKGIVKHFYGFKHGLGGIFSITCSDFEKINGFPNFWGWGYEDNSILARVTTNRIQIDYAEFIPWKKTQYIDFQDEDGLSRADLQNNDTDFIRQVNRAEFERYVAGTMEGIQNIKYIDYDEVVLSENVVQMNVFDFDTGIEEDVSQRLMYDIRNGTQPFRPTSKPRFYMQQHV